MTFIDDDYSYSHPLVTSSVVLFLAFVAFVFFWLFRRPFRMTDKDDACLCPAAYGYVKNEQQGTMPQKPIKDQLLQSLADFSNDADSPPASRVHDNGVGSDLLGQINRLQQEEALISAARDCETAQSEAAKVRDRALQRAQNAATSAWKVAHDAMSQQNQAREKLEDEVMAHRITRHELDNQIGARYEAEWKSHDLELQLEAQTKGTMEAERQASDANTQSQQLATELRVVNDANADLVLQEDRASKRQKEAEKQREAARRQRDEAVESAVEEHSEIRMKNQGLKAECERLKGSLHRIKAAKTQRSDWAKIAALQTDNARLETENGRLQAERKRWKDIMKQQIKPYTTPVFAQQTQESPPKLVATLANLPFQSSQSEAPPSPPTSNTKTGPSSAEVEANKVQNQTTIHGTLSPALPQPKRGTVQSKLPDHLDKDDERRETLFSDSAKRPVVPLTSPSSQLTAATNPSTDAASHSHIDDDIAETGSDQSLASPAESVDDPDVTDASSPPDAESENDPAESTAGPASVPSNYDDSALSEPVLKPAPTPLSAKPTVAESQSPAILGNHAVTESSSAVDDVEHVIESSSLDVERNDATKPDADEMDVRGDECQSDHTAESLPSPEIAHTSKDIGPCGSVYLRFATAHHNAK